MDYKSKRRLKSRKKRFSLKKYSSVGYLKKKSNQNIDHQLMIPESFLTSELSSSGQNRQKPFIFRGDSGHYQNNRWNFQPVDTQYATNPINYQLAIIYPNYQRLYWNGKNLINLNNQIQQNIPSWLLSLLSEEHRLDLFLETPIDNSDWTRAKVYLFDLVSHSEKLSDRRNKLNFILENCHLQWKITNIPEKEVNPEHLECPIRLFETKTVSNMHHSYYYYKESLLEGATYLLLRKPDSFYESGKSFNLLIWKPPSPV